MSRSLSSRQRYWRMVALTRLNRAKEALKLFDSAPADWRDKTGSRLLLTDALISLGKHREAEEQLEAVLGECRNREEDSKQWKFLAARIRNPGPVILGEIEPETDTQLPRFKDDEEWRRFLSTPENRPQFAFWLERIRFLVEHETDDKSLQSVLAETFQASSPGSPQAFQLYQLLKKHGCWPAIIHILLSRLTRLTNAPAEFWSQAHSHCPREHRPELRWAMREYVLRHPLGELEDFLKMFPKD